jgi:hypothetical protein
VLGDGDKVMKLCTARKKEKKIFCTGSPMAAKTVHKSLAIETPKNLSLKNINMGIKNAEFYADFKFLDADLNKCP